MPVTALNTVVLPAPFGPMIEKIWPGPTDRSSRLTAVTPPNRMVSRSTVRSDIATSHEPSRPDRRSPDPGLQLVLLPGLRQQPTRAEPHHHHENESEDEQSPATHLEILFATHPLWEQSLEPLLLELVVQVWSEDLVVPNEQEDPEQHARPVPEPAEDDATDSRHRPVEVVGLRARRVLVSDRVQRTSE